MPIYTFKMFACCLKGSLVKTVALDFMKGIEFGGILLIAGLIAQNILDTKIHFPAFSFRFSPNTIKP